MRRKGRGRQGSERRDLVLDVPGKGVRDEIWSGGARARQGSEEGVWSGGAAPHLKYFLK